MEILELETRYGNLTVEYVTACHPHEEDEYEYTEECLLVKAENSPELPNAFLIKDADLYSKEALSPAEVAEILIENSLKEDDYITDFEDNGDGTVTTTKFFKDPSEDEGFVDEAPDLDDDYLPYGIFQIDD